MSDLTINSENQTLSTAFKGFVGFIAVSAVAFAAISLLAHYGIDVRINHLVSASIIGGFGVVLIIGLAINSCSKQPEPTPLPPRIFTPDGSEFAQIPVP